LAQELVSYLSTFDLWSFAGENMPVATSCFEAVMQALPSSSAPTNFLEFYLQGMSRSSNEKFWEVCSSRWGSISNPMLVEWAHHHDVALQLDSFTATLLAKYL